MSTKDVIDCPCKDFDSIDAICDALESEDRTDRLREWLCGKVNEEASSAKRPLSCGLCCKNRIDSSLTILNSIRDACRPFLEASSGRKETEPRKDSVVYEEAFPPLAAPVVPSTKAATLVGRKKAKRRIRPAVVAPSATPSAWLHSHTGNLINAKSEVPLALGDRLQESSTREALKSSPSVNTTPRKQNVASTFDSSFITPKKILPPEILDEVAAIPQIQRLVRIYCTLIDSFLVPSSALELHLLIRLLTVKEDLECAGSGGESAISQILSNPIRCIYFGKQALINLSHILRGLGPVVLKGLVKCPVFRNRLPCLTSGFETLLEEQAPHMDTSLSLVAGNHAALLTLPFKEERDSRHNYRTREEQELYKNREESRDAFLSQLRAFLNVRGKVVDTVQAEKAIQKIRFSARVVVDKLKESNLTWFSEFFCDLLLQIGHLPLQETDKELLQIAGKDKLQKLHRRFSSLSAHACKSMKKLSEDSKRYTKISSPVAAAQHYYPGHQEFFFLFVTSADSYAFGIHLRGHLVAQIVDLSSGISRMNVEKRLMALRLLAKFLGLLIFLPNWRPPSTPAQSLIASKSLDGLHQLAAAGLSLVDVIENACETRNLVAVVPWITELLKMTTWDAIATRSASYLRLLGLLRAIEIGYKGDNGGPDMSPSSRQVVTQSIESFFEEATGLARATSLPPARPIKTVPTTDESSAMDSFQAMYGSATLYASNYHIAELVALISNLSRADSISLRSPGASRKLRPSVISPPDSIGSRPAHDEGAGNKSSLGDISTSASRSVFQAKLQNSFFHQHGELKEICEFIANKLVKHAAEQLPKRFVRPMLRDRVSLEGDNLKLEQDVVEVCLSFLDRSLQENVQKTLDTLALPGLDKKIVEIASLVTIQYGNHIGRDMIRGIVAAEIKQEQASLVRLDRKKLFTKESETGNQSEWSMKDDDQWMVITDSITKLRNALASVGGSHCDDILSAMNSVLSIFDDWPKQEDSRVPAEIVLRPFFQATLELDERSEELIDWALASLDALAEDRWHVLEAYLRITAKLTVFARHGLRNARLFLMDKKSLGKILDLGMSASESSRFGALLIEMVDSRILETASLEESLLNSMNDRSDVAANLAEECLSRLEGNMTLSTTDMPNLRKHLRKQDSSRQA